MHRVEVLQAVLKHFNPGIPNTVTTVKSNLIGSVFDAVPMMPAHMNRKSITNGQRASLTSGDVVSDMRVL
jgi:hypothetical protein